MKANIQKMHKELMDGLASLKEAKKQGLVKSASVDFRQAQSLWLRGEGKVSAPRQERLKRLKIVTHLGKGGKRENFSHIQAFYEDVKVLATTGDVFEAKMENGVHTAHVQYIKTPDGVLCMDC